MVDTGEQTGKTTRDTYTDIFSKVLCDDGKTKENIWWQLRQLWQMEQGLHDFPDSFQNVFLMWESQRNMRMTFAAGLAAGGLKPVIALYSSFLQTSL